MQTRPRLPLPRLLALLAGAVVIMVTHTGPLVRPEFLAPELQAWQAATPGLNAAAASYLHRPAETPIHWAR